MAAPPRPDGWYPLPSGGAVEFAGGTPRRLSDGGRQELDEATLLREAAALAGIPLHFYSHNRGRRWRVQTRWRWLGFDQPDSPSVALLGLDACHICGAAAGVVEVRDRHGERGPVCRACAHDIEVHGAAFAGEGEDVTCDGSCGAPPPRD